MTPMSEESARPVCPVCDVAESTFYKDWKGMRLYACGGCGTVYMFPMPTVEDVEALYADAYGGATEGYFSKVDKKMKRSRGRMRSLKKLVTGRRFLDVGSNGGFMAEAAREAGFEATGVEIDPVSVAYARANYPANAFFCGPVEDFMSEAHEGFDLIYSSEVIEHVFDPNAFVGAIARLLHPGGVFFVTTPDISHWRRPKNVEDWDAFCPPSHCLYFNPGSLAGLLERHGLVVEGKKWAFKPGIKMWARKPA